MGDGANDLKMMGIAGLSVAFRAKPVVRAQADVALNFSGPGRAAPAWLPVAAMT
jgi:phosphoserine phosphatase